MVRIVFNDIRIEEVSHSSGVFSGHNLPLKWGHRSKSNEGYGSITGDNNTAKDNVHFVIDRDVIDQLIKNN